METTDAQRMQDACLAAIRDVADNYEVPSQFLTALVAAYTQGAQNALSEAEIAYNKTIVNFIATNYN